jgi:hypothetical protein
VSAWDALFTDHFSTANPAAVALNGGSFTWAVAATGTANVEVATSYLLGAGLMPPRVLGGKRLRWEHPTLGVWTGPVTAPRSSGRDAVTEVVAKTLDWYYQGRRTPKVTDTGMASAGYVFRRAAEDRYRASDRIGVDVTVRSSRALTPSVARAHDLGGLLRDLVRQSGEEYWVDHDAEAVEWTQRAGRDKSGDIALIWGREIVDFEYAYDLEAIFNELLVVPQRSPYDRTRTISVRDEDSISRHGLRQRVEVVPGLVTRAALRSIGYALLSDYASRGDMVTVTLDDSTDVWADIDDGDSVTVILPPINCRCRARCMVRHYDLESDLLTLSMEIEEELD